MWLLTVLWTYRIRKQKYQLEQLVNERTDEIAEQIDKVQPGELVRFNGLLVNLERENGWHWHSSLTRNDTGAGACELIWVEEFEVVNSRAFSTPKFCSSQTVCVEVSGCGIMHEIRMATSNQEMVSNSNNLIGNSGE